MNDNDWPWYLDIKQTVTFIAFQTCIKLKAKNIKLCRNLRLHLENRPYFYIFSVQFFQITCVHIWISLNKNYNTPILNTCLSLCWLCVHSTTNHWVVLLWFRFVQVKKQKTSASTWLFRKLNFSEKSGFWPLLWQSGFYEKGCTTHNFCVDSRYDFFLFVEEKV